MLGFPPKNICYYMSDRFVNAKKIPCHSNKVTRCVCYPSPHSVSFVFVRKHNYARLCYYTFKNELIYLAKFLKLLPPQPPQCNILSNMKCGLKFIFVLSYYTSDKKDTLPNLWNCYFKTRYLAKLCHHP